MKIIITEQQFNLILLGEGKGTGTGFKQYTPEEVKTSEENYENLSPKLLMKYNDYVKQFEEYYTTTGKLMKIGEGKKIDEWFNFIRRHGLIPKFYKDVKRDEKIEEIKKQTYIDIVDYYNNLFILSGITITQEYNPNYGWLGKEKLKQTKKDTNFNFNQQEKNPDYSWLENNGKMREFRIATNHKQRVKDMGGQRRKYLIEKYGFIPEKATPEEVITFIYKEGYTLWVQFFKTNFPLYKILIGRGILGDVKELLPKTFFKKSLGETYIEEWLSKKGIIGFEQQYTFCDLKDIGCLLMDFYSPNFNNHQVCIEFDGRQHFQTTKFSLKDTDKILEERLNNIKKRDTIKNQYCYNNGIVLYRIKHDNLNSITKGVIDKIMGVIINDIESSQFNYEFFETGYLDTANFKIEKI